ncbi:hypothetical protein [Herbiconiux liangxiaofengii]|uniref:hypothetical protein n=1 Tax=Herbiconiux liangxiaofengii TaxID=3342795 RepID=UPI0035B73A89
MTDSSASSGSFDERGETSPLDPDHESYAERDPDELGSGPDGSSTSSPDGIGAYSDDPDASAESVDPHADNPNPDADGVA